MKFFISGGAFGGVFSGVKFPSFLARLLVTFLPIAGVVHATDFTWDWAVNTNWANPNNWDAPSAPNGLYPGFNSTNDNVYLGGRSRIAGQPGWAFLDTNVVLNSLTVQSNGSVELACKAITANIIELQDDAHIVGLGEITNRTLFRKSSGSSNSVVYPRLHISDGIIESDSGHLLVYGAVISNGIFNVASGHRWTWKMAHISRHPPAILGQGKSVERAAGRFV